jgi:hypothetical protein
MSDHDKRAINIMPFVGKTPVAESHRSQLDTKRTAQVWQRLWMVGPIESAHGRTAKMTESVAIDDAGPDLPERKDL